jgi:hypothetical protein
LSTASEPVDELKQEAPEEKEKENPELVIEPEPSASVVKPKKSTAAKKKYTLKIEE